MTNLRKHITFLGDHHPRTPQGSAYQRKRKGLNHRMYYVTTKDFRTFSKTKMFFNPDFSVIDAAIVKDPTQGDLIMVVKNENSNPPEKNLRVTRTKNIAKGFPTKVSAPITGKYWAEGPAPLFVGDALYVYLISIVIIVTELSVRWIMVKRGKMYPIRFRFRRESATGLPLR